MKIEFRVLKPPHEEVHGLSTVVFIDYEYLYISFTKRYATPPMLDEICEEMKQNGKISKIYVFGDFTKQELDQERNRVRTITSNIIDCGNESPINKKDFTDFIMLDQIYQELIQNPVVEQFIFFTGDGHFSSSATFLRNFMDKTVGVYGLAGSISRQLQDCASWTKELAAIAGKEEEYQANLLKNLKNAEDSGKYPTFKTTVQYTSQYYGGDSYRYEEVLREMIEKGYITSDLVNNVADRGSFKMLSVNWELVQKELAGALE